VVGRVAYELERIGDSGSAAGAAVLLGDLEAALSQAVAEVLAYQRGYQQQAAHSRA
jgi:hypothetical protein